MVKQYEIYWIRLNPTTGSEINKTRPCIVLSPNESNKYLNTVIIAPVTSTIKEFPMRLNILLQEKNGQIALDQICCVDKTRLLNKVEELEQKDIKKLRQILKAYLID